MIGTQYILSVPKNNYLTTYLQLQILIVVGGDDDASFACLDTLHGSFVFPRRQRFAISKFVALQKNVLGCLGIDDISSRFTPLKKE